MKAIELMVWTDMTYTIIAEEVKCNPNSITNWLKDEDFAKELNRQMRKKFNKLGLKAQRKLEKLIDSDVDSVSLNACKDILDRQGLNTVQKVESINTIITVDVEED